jgi:hypothetical protein
LPSGPAGGQGGYGAPVGGRYGGTAAANGAEQDRAGASEWETGRGNLGGTQATRRLKLRC